MIVDSSAIIAVLRREPEARRFAELILDATTVRLSTGTYVELINVVDRRIGGEALPILDEFIDKARIRLEPFTVEQARWARHARVTFGIGRHVAALNYGDCFAYALAKATGEPLLFKGDDFARTDIQSAL